MIIFIKEKKKEKLVLDKNLNKFLKLTSLIFSFFLKVLTFFLIQII